MPSGTQPSSVSPAGGVNDGGVAEEVMEEEVMEELQGDLPDGEFDTVRPRREVECSECEWWV